MLGFYTTHEKVYYYLKGGCDKLIVHTVNPRETNKKNIIINSSQFQKKEGEQEKGTKSS